MGGIDRASKRHLERRPRLGGVHHRRRPYAWRRTAEADCPWGAASLLTDPVDDDWRVLHQRFHDALVGACGLKSLTELPQKLLSLK